MENPKNRPASIHGPIFSRTEATTPVPYTYQPLPTTSCIRLLEIVNCDLSSYKIYAYLRTTSFGKDQKMPPYAALSYTWGEATTGPIEGDGIPSLHELQLIILADGDSRDDSVTGSYHREPNDAVSFLPLQKNLSNFIQNYWRNHRHRQSAPSETDAHSNTSFLIWIDAICIDQDNEDEKSTQILLMGDIYSGASRVIIWLGEETGDISEYLWVQTTLIPKLQRLAEKKGGIDVLAHSEFRVFWKYAAEELSAKEQRYLQQDLIRFLRLFCSRRRWFSRVWIVQELMLAKDVLVLCGAHQISWGDLVWISNLAENGTWQRRCLPSDCIPRRFGISPPKMLATERNQLQNLLKELPGLVGTSRDSASMDLLSLNPTSAMGRRALNLRGFVMIMWLKTLDGCRSQQSTMPQDKVFFSLGILSQLARAANVELDTKPPLPSAGAIEVWTWATGLLLEDNFLEVLGRVEPKSKRQTKGLPSWVPDWSYPFAEDNLGKMSVFQDDAAKAVVSRKCSPVSVKGGTLHLRGVRVGSITAAAEWTRGTELDSKIGVWRYWQLALTLPAVYPQTGQPSAEVFWRTMICDICYLQRPAPSAMSRAFRHWITDSLAAGFYESELEDAIEQVLQRLVHLDATGASHSRTYPSMREIETLASVIRSQRMGAILGVPARMTATFLNWIGFDVSLRDLFLGFMMSTGSLTSLFTTDSGHMGRMKGPAAVGDELWLFEQGAVPYVLRPREDGTYEFLSEAYVHGMMNGEWMTEEREKSFVEIRLV